ncbi:collagen alpha-4(VI) chain-like [Tubulanus polymorphus]|uniref:collagen alpha-4(VI) chain-like n=1 Tax=Tubulanus polymorphus TaxID=672921 RepID=UPI003DA21742
MGYLILNLAVVLLSLTSVTYCSRPYIDLVIIIEASDDVSPDEFKSHKLITMKIVDEAPINVANSFQIAVITYSSIARVAAYLNDHQKAADLKAVISGLNYDGQQSYTALATQLANDEVLKSKGRRPFASKVVILIGNGETRFSKDTVDSLAALRASETRVYRLEYGKERNFVSFFISSEKRLQLPLVITEQSATAVAKSVVDLIKKDNTCAYGFRLVGPGCIDSNECRDSNPCFNGGDCVNMPRFAKCVCPNGFLENNGECRLASRLDVAIVLDTSNYIYKTEWQKYHEMVEYALRQFFIHPDYVMVSLITYADKVNHGLWLNTCYNSKCVQRVSDALSWTGGQPNTHLALNYATKQLESEYGGRINTKKVVLYFGSGRSTKPYETGIALYELSERKIRVYAVAPGSDGSRGHLSTSLPETSRYLMSNIISVQDISTTTEILIRKIAKDVKECDYGLHWVEDKSKCVDIDECLNAKPCLNYGHCSNRRGRHHCHCEKADQRCVGMAHIDVAIILDRSASMPNTKGEWKVAYKVTKAVVERFFIHPKFIRVAVVAYDDEVYVASYLNTCSNTDCIISAMDSQQWSKTTKQPKLWKVLDFVHKRVLQGPGGRNDRNDVIIYIGQGKHSNNEKAITALQHILFDEIRVYSITYNPPNEFISQVVNNASQLVMPPTPSNDKEIDNTIRTIVWQVVEDAFCKKGYFLPFKHNNACTDIDECSEIKNPCLYGGTCVNTDGGHLCPCPFNSINCVEVAQVDVAIYMDLSNGTSQTEFSKLVILLKQIVLRLAAHPRYVRISVSGVNDNVTQIVTFDKYTNSHEIAQAIDNAGWQWTNNSARFCKAFEDADILLLGPTTRFGVPKAVVALTSGETTDRLVTHGHYMRLFLDKIRVYAVSLGGVHDFINTILPPGQGIKLGTSGLKTKHFDAYALQLSRRVVDDSHCQFGYHSVAGKCVDVDECGAKNPCVNGGECKNLGGTFACPCKSKDITCHEMAVADVVVLLDGSNAVNEKDFPQMLRLFQQVVKRFFIHPHYIHIAVAIYSDQVTSPVGFADCDDTQCVLDATKTWSWRNGKPVVHEAINYARNKLFRTDPRPSVATKSLVLIGTGVATERVPTLDAITDLAKDEIRLYALVYQVEDDVVEKVIPDQHLIYIPHIFNSNTSIEVIAAEVTAYLTADIQCHFGYFNFKGRCNDVDECLNTEQCYDGTKCVNKAGSYNCQ